MKVRLYLLLTPEALIASHLEPEAFGKYLALGSRRQNSGPALFFELNPEAMGKCFGADEREQLCVPHEGGQPRRSSYLAIYRVLEQVPPEAMGALYLVTKTGFSLALEQGSYAGGESRDFYLYQELAPVGPRAVSLLGPEAFGQQITGGGNRVALPRLVFADMKLGPLARDLCAPAGNLPYANLEHLRNCLTSLRERSDKPTKILNRDTQLDDLFYMVEGGFFVAGGGVLLHYPMPDEDTLNRDHRTWWHAARAFTRL